MDASCVHSTMKHTAASSLVCTHNTFASFLSLSISSATDATMTPPLRLAGDSTLIRLYPSVSVTPSPCTTYVDELLQEHCGPQQELYPTMPTDPSAVKSLWLWQELIRADEHIYLSKPACCVHATAVHVLWRCSCRHASTVPAANTTQIQQSYRPQGILQSAAVALPVSEARQDHNLQNCSFVPCPLRCSTLAA